MKYNADHEVEMRLAELYRLPYNVAFGTLMLENKPKTILTLKPMLDAKWQKAQAVIREGKLQ